MAPSDDVQHDPLRSDPIIADRAHVVVGVDGSQASERALHYAFGAAGRLAAGVIVVHVRRTWVVVDAVCVQAVLDDPGLDPDFRAAIDRLAAECGIEATFLDVPSLGPAAQVLSRVAEKYRADVVVVGTSHKLFHRVRGSTGARLVKRCQCPVTVVP
jgi:nucleotide-binding universal stress UspA family protein